MFGDKAFPYVDGSDPFLVNHVQIGVFAKTNANSWQMRYDFDFVELGITGLTFMSGMNRPGFSRHSQGSLRNAFQTLPVTADC